MELPALLVCPIFYFLNTSNLYSLNTFFIFLWVLHYTNRTIIYPLRIKTKGKKNKTKKNKNNNIFYSESL